MIVYKQVLERLAAVGYTSYRLQREKLLSGSTLDRLRNNGPVSTETIDTVCRLCGCQPADLMRYVPNTGE